MMKLSSGGEVGARSRDGVGRRRVLGGIAAASAAIAAPPTLRAQTRQLTISSWLPLGNPVPYHVIAPWADAVRELTAGRVDAVFLDGPLGPPPRHYDIVRSGAADLAFTLHGYSGDDAFVRARIGQFSFIGDSYGASPTFAEIYADQLNGAAEYEGVVPLFFFTHGPGQVFLRGTKVEKPEDFRGLRIRTSGGYISKLLQDLGATTVPMPPNQAPDALRRGDIDGVCFPYEAVVAFGMQGASDAVLEFPGGIYNATWFFAMNQQTWSGLERQDREAIREVSFLMPELAGKAWDEADYSGIEASKASGMDIYRAPPALLDHVTSLAARHERDWAEQLARQGYDGERALATLRRRTDVSRL